MPARRSLCQVGQRAGSGNSPGPVQGALPDEPRAAPGEKRKLPESLTLEDAKRIRVMGDIPMELVNEVMLTITDPAAMLGPEVRAGGARGDGTAVGRSSWGAGTSGALRSWGRGGSAAPYADQPVVGQRGAG